ncbi:reverse transcriptase [Vibrio vulnificus]|nr:reverse transcriptase [Vibrio vulnificus]
MSKLTDDSLEFARKHIENYYDSDFFPKAFEYESIWHNWDKVKQHLTGTNVNKLRTKHPLTMASKKPSGSYRIVHQLEPIDTIIYTALAYLVTEQIEAVRAEKNVACSYRFALSEGGFFDKNSGFKNFTDVVEKLSDEYEFILITDITDFYNQIYLHRLHNAIERADSSLSNLAGDIEQFIMAINDKASQGIPVGPAASIIMSEATLVDIDEFISNKGIEHARYVDDFRIYANSRKELENILESLTIYLHETHRLTLASDKTKILSTKKYVESVLHNQYEMEKVEIFETLEILNPYSGEIEFEEVVVTEIPDLEEHLEHITEQIFKRSTLDLGLARALIRKAKKNKIESVADTIFDNFELFIPVINDVVLYFKAIQSDEFDKNNVNKFISIVESGVVTSKLARYWLEWYFATNSNHLKNIKIKKFINDSDFVENQALAAITSGNVSWVRDNKNRVFYVGEKGKRAILYASKILPKDERNNWLRNIDKNTPEELDKWLIKWLLDTC